MKLLLLLRGAPGAGKTTIAMSLVSRLNTDRSYNRVTAFAADDYFYNKHGDYLFVPEMLPRAHSFCRENVEEALQIGKSDVIIVHNTFCKEDDMKEYYRLAHKYSALCASVVVEGRRYSDKVEDDGEWLGRENADIKSKHNVPEVTINRMINELKGNVLI